MNDSPAGQPPRVLVFLVSYEARRHITATLDRIPAELLAADSNVDLLLIDDASNDDTATLARDWASRRGFTRLTVLRNPVNQGYGGNQKLGYRLAIEHGYDFVILLHGDGQYAPEMLPTFIQTFRETDADVVLGTRMDSIKSARAGGMPWYKVGGNTALTWFQNKMTGQQLTEYHTGFRAYSTRFLRAVPFETNTNAFHFDTEILLQAFHVGAKLEQFPIPTHYGDEVCRVDGTRYAKDVVFSTLQFRLHQLGMLCSLKYRNLAPLRYRDKGRTYSAHQAALAAVRTLKPRTLLDLGDAPAALLDACREEGIVVSNRAEAAARRADVFDFDAILMLDSLEDQAEPEALLIALRNDARATRAIRKPPAIVLTTPNAAFAAMRLNLLLGRFSYAERGILHVDHKRLFTRRSLRRSLAECGYTVQRLAGIAVPFEAVLDGWKGRALQRVAAAAARVWPTMFAFQFLVVARPLPGVNQLLAQSEQLLDGPADAHRVSQADVPAASYGVPLIAPLARSSRALPVADRSRSYER